MRAVLILNVDEESHEKGFLYLVSEPDWVQCGVAPSVLSQKHSYDTLRLAIRRLSRL